MAVTQNEVRAKAAGAGLGAPRNTRRNEIVAIALFATSALLALCLASYHAFDESWNASGQARVENLVGSIGANVSAALFQTFGFAAILLPLLLIAAAWRRFRTRRIHAPLSRVVGLVALVLAVASLFALFVPRASYDGSFESGGLIGVFFADQLKGMLNTVGAAVLLSAVAATGLLLATNFSFAHAYERVSAALGDPSGLFRTTLERFRAWRESRRALAQARVERRREARAERERELAESRQQPVESLAESLSAKARTTKQDESRQTASAATAIKRAAANVPEAEDRLSPEDALRAEIARQEAELASIALQVTNPSATVTPPVEPAARAPRKRVTVEAPAEVEPVPDAVEPPSHQPSAARVAAKAAADAADIEEMLSTAEVVRTEPVEEAVEEPPASDAKAERAARRAARTAAMLDDYKLPGNDFLNAAPPRHEQADEELLGLATRVAEKCKEFNVMGRIEHICPGPVVTTYEFKPDPGVKYSRVTGLVDDLCLALKAESIRIDRVPGKAHVGIEVPNPRRETIHMREVIESRQFRESESKLTLALGKTIDGINYIADLTRMPHLLIAGATGTGKSVCLNSLVVSILYKARPDEVKFIMIDPKRLELGLYADIPHLATPIITDPKRAANALKWAVGQMEQRYKDLARWGVRNIDGYNTEVERRNNVLDFDDEGQPHKPLPYIVILIDELADLMMTCGHDVEESITRLAQMARAVGIHLVLATQRPSVDVITGLIKANFPSRIAFRVSSKVDSRTIIDSNGAEQLLGRGDMLFLPPGTSRLVRVHGAFLDETEVARVVSHIKAQGEPVYDETITQSEEEASGGDGEGGERDELFEQALRICVEMKRASTSVLQRRLRIGYGRAAAILDAMEREGFIGQADGSRPRPVLGRAFETVSHWDDLQANAGDVG
jgi:S-DNA-T family DNA segregation ATPase FtsK/SpoIIIE